jgi:hypothetical protein
MLLAGYDARVTQHTAIQYTTLSGATRAGLNDAIERMRLSNNAETTTDCTDLAVQKKLARLFGEVAAKPAKAAKTPLPTVSTFAGLGINNYLPE